MSYCVNCGVELEKNISQCPLCGTEVNNPKQCIDETSALYPQKRAIIEPTDRKETALLLTIILSAPSVGCAIMNFLIFGKKFWSLYVIGACIIIWTFIVPPLLFKKLPNIIYIILDDIVVIGYIYIFVLQFGNKGWFQNVAIPIVIFISILFLILLNIYGYYKPGIMIMSITTVAAIGIFCIGVETILNFYLKGRLYILWSAVVMVCCCTIIIPLAIIMNRPKLREEVRRRMHV